MIAIKMITKKPTLKHKQMGDLNWDKKYIPAHLCNHKPVSFSLNNFLQQVEHDMELRLHTTLCT